MLAYWAVRYGAKDAPAGACATSIWLLCTFRVCVCMPWCTCTFLLCLHTFLRGGVGDDVGRWWWWSGWGGFAYRGNCWEIGEFGKVSMRVVEVGDALEESLKKMFKPTFFFGLEFWGWNLLMEYYIFLFWRSRSKKYQNLMHFSK